MEKLDQQKTIKKFNNKAGFNLIKSGKWTHKEDIENYNSKK